MDLANVCNSKQQVHCALSSDLLVTNGLLCRGRYSVLEYPLAFCEPVCLTLVYRVFRGARGVELKQRGLSNHLLWCRV